MIAGLIALILFSGSFTDPGMTGPPPLEAGAVDVGGGVCLDNGVLGVWEISGQCFTAADHAAIYGEGVDTLFEPNPVAPRTFAMYIEEVSRAKSPTVKALEVESRLYTPELLYVLELKMG